MKARLLAVMIAALALSGVASAQSYSIRVTFNTNLRAAASLQARIIETAPAGTTLNVNGESNRWLRINRNGATVWMASWVRHERVEATTTTQTQTVSNIDNCCFVDRQCSTDQEWTGRLLGIPEWPMRRACSDTDAAPGIDADPSIDAARHHYRACHHHHTCWR